MSEPITGLAFPFRFEGGRLAVQRDGDAKLRENLLQLLLTTVGERVMRRDYGGGLRQLLHDPDNDALRAIVQHQVAKAIAAHEPRIAVQRLDVGQDGATLTITVHYVVRRTRATQQLSVPIGLAPDGAP